MQNLPGKSAQSEMASPHRLQGLFSEKPVNPINSAVMVMLSSDGNEHSLMDYKVLLIRRSIDNSIHSGQIAFPGGRAEDRDNSLWDTACRETREELGIERKYLKKIGQLSKLYVPPSNYMIYPFLASLSKIKVLKPQKSEVADYKYIPLSNFNPKQAVILDFLYSQSEKRPAPAWIYEDFIIWGATAMILAELYRLTEQNRA